MRKDQSVWAHEDSALVLIDYKKEMFENIRAETSTDLIDLNVRLMAKAARKPLNTSIGRPPGLAGVFTMMGGTEPIITSFRSDNCTKL